MFHDFFEKGTFDITFFSQTFCQMMKIHPKKHWGKVCNLAWQCKSEVEAKPSVHYCALHRRFKENGERDENIITWLGNLNEK